MDGENNDVDITNNNDVDITNNDVEMTNTVVSFPKLVESAQEEQQYRKIPIPSHRLTPLRNAWVKLYTPLVEHLGLQVRFNPATRSVELRTSNNPTSSSSSSSSSSTDIVTHDRQGAIQRGADYIRAFSLGFPPEDALALLRLDDIYLETVEIRDVRSLLAGDHLARAIGRLAGKDGRTRATIETASRTRIVLADSRVHILGAYRNIRVAKDAIVSLIRGSTPGRVYNRLRSVSARLTERTF